MFTFPVIQDYAVYNWAAVETKMPKEKVNLFINAFPKEFEMYRRESDIYTHDSLIKSLHFVDVNGDGKDDVFFDGQSYGEPRLIELFIKTTQGYKKVFSEMQGIAKIDWEDHKIKRLYINNWGCCSDYQETNKIFELSFNQQGLPSFKQVYQSVTCYLMVAKRPDSLFEKPIRFEVLNENYNIRITPKIDESYIGPWNQGVEDEKKLIKSNSIGRLPKGMIGTALGKKTDATGREWWYVEVDEQYKPDTAVFYLENKFPTRVIGWISSRFVKVL